MQQLILLRNSHRIFSILVEKLVTYTSTIKTNRTGESMTTKKLQTLLKILTKSIFMHIKIMKILFKIYMYSLVSTDNSQKYTLEIQSMSNVQTYLRRKCKVHTQFKKLSPLQCCNSYLKMILKFHHSLCILIELSNYINEIQNLSLKVVTSKYPMPQMTVINLALPARLLEFSPHHILCNQSTRFVRSAT